jgi:hypothetical protein
MSSFVLPVTALRLLCCTVFLAVPVDSFGASMPSWWIERGFVSSFAQDDFAVANAGQLKNAVSAMVDEMNEKLSGGAGTALNTLVADWRAGNATADNEVAVNQGQVKAAFKACYDRLNEVHGTAGYYPWAGTTPDDYALANVGQIKKLMAVDVTLAPGSAQTFGPSWLAAESDSDGDGLPAWFEWLLGTDPNDADSDDDSIHDGDEDPDSDGLSNRWELALGLNPLNADTDNDGIPDSDEDFDGDGLTNAQELLGGTSPLTSDTDGDGVSDSQESADGTDPLDGRASLYSTAGLRIHTPLYR